MFFTRTSYPFCIYTNVTLSCSQDHKMEAHRDPTVAERILTTMQVEYIYQYHSPFASVWRIYTVEFDF